jgi:type III secretion protein C
MDNKVTSTLNQVQGPTIPSNPLSPQTLIDGTTMGSTTSTNSAPLTPGFSTGSIGRKVLYHNSGFLTFAALVNAVRSDQDINIIMNPKITTEHNVPAEIFVGAKIGIKGQSISNDTGSIVTTNYETRDTGITLKVTPLISANNTVTLIIDQSISTANQASVNAQGQNNAPPATINETRTVTRVHLPSEHFIVLSGMISEQLQLTKDQIPCLGGLPLIGNLFANTSDVNSNRAIMMFLRPYVIETSIDIDEITKRQQDIYKEKTKPVRKQVPLTEDALRMLNIWGNQ